MGSAIHVESQLSVGSRFWFELLAPVVADVVAAPPPPTRPISGYTGPQRTILVVDDNPQNRAVLVDLLAPLGFGLLEAADGRAAVAKAQALRLDLILMDLRLPLMTGVEATRAIRQLPELQGVVIIATSASVFDADRQQSLLAGCNAFLPKPIRAQQLLNLIATHLRLKWRYAEGQPISAPMDAAEVDALVPPPPEELAILYELAIIGDIMGLQARADQLAQGDPAVRPFAQRLTRWAGRFESEQVLALIDRYL
jgi:CheY-like chemotaxis protein